MDRSRSWRRSGIRHPGCCVRVNGVGALTAVAYLFTLEDPARFEESREVGPYLGLVPRQDGSGDSSPPLGITKTGDQRLRRRLGGSAHSILGPFGTDCDLRRFGLKLAARGGKNAKKRAGVAGARKLAVLLHSLWVTGEVYEPLRNNAPQKSRAVASTRESEARGMPRNGGQIKGYGPRSAGHAEQVDEAPSSGDCKRDADPGGRIADGSTHFDEPHNAPSPSRLTESADGSRAKCGGWKALNAFRELCRLTVHRWVVTAAGFDPSLGCRSAAKRARSAQRKAVLGKGTSV
jgi:hypothetical protein